MNAPSSVTHGGHEALSERESEGCHPGLSLPDTLRVFAERLDLEVDRTRRAVEVIQAAQAEAATGSTRLGAEDDTPQFAETISGKLSALSYQNDRLEWAVSHFAQP